MRGVPEISDEDYNKLLLPEQDEYNARIGAANELTHAQENYEISMSLWGPALMAGFGLLFTPIFGLGIPFIIIAIVWVFYRVTGRSHAYQRFKDAENNMRDVFAAQSR